VVVAGQSGLAGHLKIGNKVVIAAKTGVMRDLPDGGPPWLGIPAAPDKQTKRQWLAIERLPALIRRVKAIEKKLGVDGE
jgi:UDP-3-O-[3-hydroxymyristoyl] glucosamine N-acyltransferase